MKFIGFIDGAMIELVDVLFDDGRNNYVFRDADEDIKLAIKVANINGIESFALYLWNEFDCNDERNEQIIQDKSEETVRLFRESIGLYNTNHPTSIYNEVQTIIQQNGTIEDYQETLDTYVVVNENGISLEHYIRRNVWLVKIRGIVSYSFNNENSARRFYRLIERDIENYIRYRWSRL